MYYCLKNVLLKKQFCVVLRKVFLFVYVLLTQFSPKQIKPELYIRQHKSQIVSP